MLVNNFPSKELFIKKNGVNVEINLGKHLVPNISYLDWIGFLKTV